MARYVVAAESRFAKIGERFAQDAGAKIAPIVL